MVLQPDEKGRIDTLLGYGEEIKNFDVDEAMKIANDTIARSKSVGYLQGRGKASCLKGFCHRLKGEYDAGLQVLKEALSIAQKIHDYNMEATALYYLGN